VSELRFRAVVLDLFDTLVKWSPDSLPEMEIRGRRIRTTIPWLVPSLEHGLGAAFRLDAFLEAYGAVLAEIQAERLATSVEITCHERFRRTLERLSVEAAEAPELAERLTRAHMAAVRSVTSAPPERAAVVPLLAERYRLGILSNFDDAQTAHEILADTGVAGHFEVVVISAEARVRKPHPEIFRRVLAGLGLSPRQVLFVGDNVREDVVGAHGAGIPVAWLSDNKGDYPADLTPPDYTIRDLTELPKLLGLEKGAL
jgi:putative hydrolase of the HAD superfamily